MLVHQRNQLIDIIIKNMQDESSENNSSSQQKNAGKDNIIVRKVNNRRFKNPHNVANILSKSLLPPMHHVYKLFNTFGINLLALKTSEFQQSFIRTYFYHRTVTKVQKYHNAVVISIIPISETLTQPSHEYIVQKLKSYGNSELYRLATLIEQLWASLFELKNQKMDAVIQQDKQSITKYLNLLGKEMFVIKFGIYKIAFSNNLLQHLGYNVDEFCIQTIKYRTVLFDFMSSDVYHKILFHALTTLKNLLAVDLNKLSMEDYLTMSYMEFTDYIYSKDNKKTYCDIQFTIPVRGIICFKFKKLHYQVSQLSWKSYCTSYDSTRDSKKRINEREFELLNKLGVIPSNWLNKSKAKVAGYRIADGVQNQQNGKKI